MQKRMIPFLLAILLLFCGCSHSGRPDSAGLDEKDFPSDANIGGSYITIHAPDHSVPPDLADPSAQTGEPAADTAPDTSAADSQDNASDDTPEEPGDKEDGQSARVPIYPVDGDQNYGSDHSLSGSGQGEEAEADESGSKAPPQVGEPDASENTDGVQPSGIYDITAYVMNTVYSTDTGEQILELRIHTPVIESKASEAEVLFNRHFSARSLEYTLYINETVYPELEALPQTDGEPALSSAVMDYSILYHDDGYLCVLTSYTEELPDRFDERREAALFDMVNAVLTAEWDAMDTSDMTLEAILERIDSAQANSNIAEEDEADA